MAGEPAGLPPRYVAGDVEPRVYERWLASGAFTPAAEPPGRGRAVRDHHAAAQRHRLAAHRPRPVRDGAGRPHPVPPHARRRHAVGPRRRPRVHRRPVRPGQDHRRGGGEPREPGPGGVPGADVALHGRDARGDLAPAPPAGRQCRLVTEPVHHGRGQRAGGPGRVQTAVGCGARVSRRGDGQLVPALPDHDQRPREHPPRPDRHAVDDPLPPGRAGRGGHRGPVDLGGHHPPRDPARRRGGGRPSGRRSVSGARRPRGHPPVPRAAPADHRRRRGGPRLRHRSGEDHPGPRPGRLPDEPPPQPARHLRPGRGGPRQRGRRRVRRPGSVRCPRRHRGPPQGHGRPRGRGRAPDGGGHLRPVRDDHRAAPLDPVVHPDRDPGRPGPGIGPRRAHHHPAPALREGVRPLDGEHPRLGGGASAVVGPSDPGLVLPRRPHHGQRRRGGPGRLCRVRPSGRRAHPGDRHLRHLVQQRAVALLDPGLARRHGRTCAASTRPRSWRPATTSCSSGWPG